MINIISGNGLSVHEIKIFIQSSYIESPPQNLLGYILDNELSNLYGKVYVNEDIKKIKLSFRGTGTENLGTHWINNLVYLANSSGYKLTQRFQTALKMYNSAMKKYQRY
jgi:hypothetical protein